MVKNMNLDDFRSVRQVLEPEDFAVSDGEPDPPPTDLIECEAWRHIMTLPCDVAIRTTSYQGSKISLLHDLLSEWIFLMPMKGIGGSAMSAIADNLQASIFNVVHGHYKTALTVLRVALETSVVAARCALAGDQARWDRWERGDEFKFGNACDEILGLAVVTAREDQAAIQAGIGVFRDRTPGGREAWARSLYGRLCRYSHASGSTTDKEIWDSNGPIYSARGLRVYYYFFLETYALMLILANWAFDLQELKHNGKLVLRQESLLIYMEKPFWMVAAYYRDLFWHLPSD